MFEYLNQPVCNTVKKILIGKLFRFHNYHKSVSLIILGVKRSTYGYYEVLVGRFYGYLYPIEGGCLGNVEVYSWYCYNPKYDFNFIGRSNKRAIRNCIKKRPELIVHHIGKNIDVSQIKVNDSAKYYETYLKTGC